MSSQNTLKRPLTPSVDPTRPPGWHELLGAVGDSLYRAALSEGVKLRGTAGELTWRRSGEPSQWLAKADRELRRFERRSSTADKQHRERLDKIEWLTGQLRAKAEQYAEWAEGIAGRNTWNGSGGKAAEIASRLRAIAGGGEA